MGRGGVAEVVGFDEARPMHAILGGGLRGKVSEENQSGVKDALTEVVEVGGGEERKIADLATDSEGVRIEECGDVVGFAVSDGVAEAAGGGGFIEVETIDADFGAFADESFQEGGAEGVGPRGIDPGGGGFVAFGGVDEAFACFIGDPGIGVLAVGVAFRPVVEVVVVDEDFERGIEFLEAGGEAFESESIVGEFGLHDSGAESDGLR